MKNTQRHPRWPRALFYLVISLLTIAAISTAPTVSAGATVRPTASSHSQHSLATASRDHFELHFHNRTQSTVHVVLKYKDYKGHCDQYPFNGWEIEGWWKVGPGADVHVLNTRNRYVYFYAKSDDGSVWNEEGNPPTPVLNKLFSACSGIYWKNADDMVRMKRIDMGKRFNVHTVNLWRGVG